MAKRHCEDWITSYLTFTENSEPPELYKLWVAISVLASALQRKCYLSWEKDVYPNMYIVLVGPSGKCRKGTAMYPGEYFLRKLGVKLSAEAITREALIRELQSAGDATLDPRKQQHIIHSSLTVYSKELTVFLGYNNMNLMADLADWYDCANVWIYRTKTQGSDEIINVWMNLIGATTPELIQTTLPRDAIGGGLASRIVFVYEDKKGKVVPAPFLTQKHTLLGEHLLEDLNKINMMSGEFKITDDFLDLWTEWYVGQEENPPFDDSRFAGYFQRRPQHALKLSMILSASQGEDMLLDAKVLQRGIDVLIATEKKMSATFRGMGQSDVAEVTNRVMTAIAKEGRRGITVTQLLRQFYFDADKFTMERILSTLYSMKFCEPQYTNIDTIVRYIPKDKRVYEQDKQETKDDKIQDDKTVVDDRVSDASDTNKEKTEEKG